MKKLCLLLCFITQLLFNTIIQAQAAKPPYPIIFVHGLTGDDRSFNETLFILRDNFRWGSDNDSLYAFDVVLNADNDEHSSNIDDDVKWENFIYNGKSITVGRRNLIEDKNDFRSGWGDKTARLFAINFAEERIRGAWGTLNDLFDWSNESAIMKQGKALGEMIKQVLQFTQCEKVILVGHSMGGLAIREYLQRTINNDNSSNHRWWVEPNKLTGHRVAKVVTIGTPHGGSNDWNIPLLIQKKDSNDVKKSGWPPNINSEAVRDLRYNYITLEGTSPNPSSDDGLFLFGGSETNQSMYLNGYHNYDVNCNGDESNTITGINSWKQYGSGYMCIDNPQMPLPNIPYVWITSLEDGNSSIEHGDGVVRLDRQYLLTPGDTLKTYFKHTDESKDYYSIIRGLDEPDNYSLAYKINTNQDYIGIITKNSQYDHVNPNFTDTDVYKFSLSTPSNIQINIYGSLSGVREVSIENSKMEYLAGEGVKSFPFSFQYQNVPAGEYYLKIVGTANANTWLNPYGYIVKTTPISTLNDFDVDVTSGTAPLTVNFQYKSSGNIISWEWDFNNDGTIDSHEQNPVFIYSEPGIYSVKLTVSDGTTNHTIIKENLITVRGDVITADFEAEATSGIAPFTVRFTDKSTGIITRREWDFNNDGTVDSYVKNPIHTYSTSGVYSVKLTVFDGTNTNSQLKENFITVNSAPILAKLAEAEFYFDIDPGLGNGTKINISNASDYQIDSKLDVTSLNEGVHILGIRVKDENGRWSFTYHKLFLKERVGYNDTRLITKGEYFINVDPGYGNGTNLSLNQSSVISLSEILDINGLPEGVHNLVIRFKDSAGNWTQHYHKMFLVVRFSNAEDVLLTKLEYYIDQDPGYDLAIPVPFVTAENIEKNFTIDLSSVASGIHTLFLRGQDNHGSWSHLYSKTFLKESRTAVKTLKRLEYFIDNDPGYGSGISIGNVSSEKDSVTFIADLKNISPGIHLFNCRAMDSENKWSLLFSKMFLVENSSQSKLITAVEYFFDEDPGYGKGNKVTINPSGDLSIQFNPDIKLLTTGTHKLFIRVKDDNGTWSFVNGHDFEKVVELITNQIKLMSGWNMVSMPINLADMNVASIFPNAASKLFQFNNGYAESSIFSKGKGYWLKFENGFTKELNGETFADNKIDLQAGWNILGGYENNIPVNKIKTSSSDLIQSNFFGYSNGYRITDTLKAGNAYWVKAKSNGFIDSSSSNAMPSKLAKITESSDDKPILISITDQIGESQVLFLGESIPANSFNILPPVPPSGIFDVRWATDRYIESIIGTNEILISSAASPLSIKVEGVDFRIKDKVGGQIVNQLVRNGESITISNPAIERLEVTKVEIPTKFELYQNYPNPFNPSTVIRYQIAETNIVTLKIYDLLGREVTTLVNEIQQPGVYSVEFRASMPKTGRSDEYASGIYFYQLTAGKFNEVKKMLLLK